MKYIKFKLDSTLKYDKNNYRFLFFNDDKEVSTQVLFEHFNKNFVKCSPYNNFLYKIPEYIDLDFIFKYYNVRNDDEIRSNFIIKYINIPTIIHFDFILQNYNMGFIYQFYNVQRDYNLNTIYDYVYHNQKNIQYYNSRKCIIKNNTKLFKRVNVIYNINFNINNIYIIKNNLDNILKSKYINNFVIIYSLENESLGMKVDAIFKNYNDKLIIINYPSHMKSADAIDVKIKNSEDNKDPNFSLVKKYYYAYSFLKTKYKDEKNCTFLLLNSRLYIDHILDDIINFYFNIENKYLSLYDFYDIEYSYNVSLDFFLTDAEFFYYNFYKNNIRKNITNFSKQNTNTKNMLTIPLGYISVDDFMPYLYRSFNKKKLIKKPHLLHRKDCPVYDLSSITYLNVINNVVQINNIPHIKIGILLHIGKLERLIFENLYSILNNYCVFTFLVYISISNKISQEEFTNFVCENNFDVSKFSIFYTENIGADLYPFMEVYLTQMYEKHDVNYILKIHTKTDIVWRNELLYPFIHKLEKSVQILYSYQHIGCISSGEWILPNEFMNKEYFINFMDRYRHLDFNTLKFSFVGGTIFLIKKSILDLFFDDFKINLNDEKDLFSQNACYEHHNNHKDIHYAHCWERIISGLTVAYSKCMIFGL
jgi:hypothetical protein